MPCSAQTSNTHFGTREIGNLMAPMVWIPDGHSFITFPVPAITDSATDDGATIINALESGNPRGAGPWVREHIDRDEQPDEDG